MDFCLFNPAAHVGWIRLGGYLSEVRAGVPAPDRFPHSRNYAYYSATVTEA
jgi:hypothetical protein